MEKVIRYLVLGGILIVSLGFIALRGMGYYQCVQAGNWPQTTGRIVYAGMRNELHYSSSSTMRQGITSKTRYYQYPVLTYVFSVDGKEFEGSNLHFASDEDRVTVSPDFYPPDTSAEEGETGFKWIDQEGIPPNAHPEVAQVLQEHPSDSNVSVFYNPQNPNQSLLFQGCRLMPKGTSIWDFIFAF